MEYKDTNNIFIFNTKKFNKTVVTVLFSNAIKKENITKNRLLMDILTSTNKNYNTIRLFASELENLYMANINSSFFKVGNIMCNAISISFINHKDLRDDIMKKSIDLLLECIFKPNAVANKFCDKTFKNSKDKLKNSLEMLKNNTSLYSRIRANEQLDGNDINSYRYTGYLEELDNINSKNLYQYYKEFINSSNISVIAIGSFNEKELVKRLDSFDIKNNTNKKISNYKISYDIVSNKKEFVESIESLKQSRLNIIAKIKNITDYERDYVLPIYSSILGGGTYSKLFLNVREKESLAYNIFSYPSGDNSLLFIECGIDNNDSKKVIKLIEKEIKNMSRNISNFEISSAKNEMLSENKSVYDNQSSILLEIITQQVFSKDDIKTRNEKIKKVTKSDIYNLVDKINIDIVFLLNGGQYEKD